MVEIIKSASVASYSNKNAKLPYIEVAINNTETIKLLLRVAWEIDALEDKKYLTLSAPIDEIGRMLGGWRGQTLKQNSPTN